MNEKPQKSFFWSFLRTILLVAFVLAGVYGYLLWVNRFPKLEGPREVTFKWEYQHQNFELKETLYRSVEAYYAKKEKGILTSKEESSIEKYLTPAKEDNTIEKVSSDLVGLAKTKNLTKDETADLALAFVQSIPYDTKRASTDLTHPRYPYEVLYENLGICSDKTLLADALLRKLGYGTSIFLFTKDQHMALGVSCPGQYSSYNSGYCFAETTAVGNRIGLIPELKEDRQATSPQAMPSYSETQSSTSTKKLSDPLVVSKTTGLSYEGIIKTIALLDNINTFKSDLGTLNSQITADENSLQELGAELEGYKSTGEIEKYNALVPTYNSLLSKIKDEISEYNAKVQNYNTLILQFN